MTGVVSYCTRWSCKVYASIRQAAAGHLTYSILPHVSPVAILGLEGGGWAGENRDALLCQREGEPTTEECVHEMPLQIMTSELAEQVCEADDRVSVVSTTGRGVLVF